MMMIRRTKSWAAAMLFAAPLLTACDKQGAYGEADGIIVAMAPELWEQVGETLQDALEPRIRTVRDERMFRVTYQDPGGQYWGDLRRFKHLLLVGTPQDPWMELAVKKLDVIPPAPGVAQVHDVWARGQLATLLFIDEAAGPESVSAPLDELRELFQHQYRVWAVNRMFISGRNSDLTEALRRDAGFGLMLPNVYRVDRSDSIFVFRNDQPDPSELIREVVVASRRLSTAGELTPEALLDWRKATQEAQDYPQLVQLADATMGPMDFGGASAFQIQAVWQNPPDALWPAAGPFILRAVSCPAQDRLYLIDAWLYAPGKSKFEYMIQLETVLNSFECGA